MVRNPGQPRRVPADGPQTDWLEEAAQEAGNPDAFPSEAAMMREEMRMHESLMAHAAAQMRRDAERAEKAAERAEEAAERAEAAEAGPSTINNTTNNNTTNNITNNIHIHTDERTAKRLKQSVLPFLMAPPPS